MSVRPGGAPAGVRAVLRLGRRDAWRNRGRSALIAVMVALPVLTLSAASVIYRSAQRDPQDWVTLRLGAQAQAWARYAGTSPVEQSLDGSRAVALRSVDTSKVADLEPVRARLASVVPASDQLVPDRTGSSGNWVVVNGRAVATFLREFDYHAAGTAVTVTQLSGRSPRSVDEVVVSQALARRARIGIGDQLSNLASDKSFDVHVVGIVDGVSLRGHAQVIGLPGSLLPTDLAPAAESLAWLVTGPGPVDAAQVTALNQAGFVVTSRAVIADPPPKGHASTLSYRGDSTFGENNHLPMAGYGVPAATVIGVTAVAIGLALVQIALLAGPAIAVGARRNERTLALLSASGAAPWQLRSVVLVGTGVVGMAGCVLAAALGTGLGVLGVPLLRRYAHQQLVRTDVHLLDLLVLVLVGTGTAVAAALLPARLAGRVNVIDVLTGRRTPAAPRRRLTAIGLLAILVGAAACYYGSTGLHPFITVAGIAVAELGLITLTGTIIALCARVAGRLPFPARFALRDAVRQRGRTAPAVAAVMAAVAGSVAVGICFTSQQADGRLISPPISVAGDMFVRFREPPTADLQSAVVADLSRIPLVKQAALYRTVDASKAELDSSYQPDGVPFPGWTRDRLYASAFGSTLVDDGSTLELLTGVPDPTARAALAAGKAVVYDPGMLRADGTVQFRLSTVGRDGELVDKGPVQVPAVLSSARPGLEDAVLPPSAASTLGLSTTVSGVVFSTTRMPTELEEQKALAALQGLAPLDFWVERDDQGGDPAGLLALVTAAIITLGGTFSAVGLAAAEGRADASTLAAVGAEPALRRRLATAQAGVITLLGGGFGLVTGCLAAWLLVRLRAMANGYGQPGLASYAVPWITVLTAAFGVPLLAIALAYLTTRSRLPLVRRIDR